MATAAHGFAESTALRLSLALPTGYQPIASHPHLILTNYTPTTSTLAPSAKALKGIVSPLTSSPHRCHSLAPFLCDTSVSLSLTATMSNMVPSTPSYNNADYLHNLLRQQQQLKNQPQQRPPTSNSSSSTPPSFSPSSSPRGHSQPRGGHGGGHPNPHPRDSGDSSRGRGGGWRGHDRGGRGGRGGRDGGGGRGGSRGSRGAWRGRGGRGGGGGGGGGHRQLLDDPHYDFETGQTDPKYPIGWDRSCTLVASLPSIPTPPTPPHTEDEPPAKRAKGSGSADPPSWRDYHPHVLGTFSLDLSGLSSSPPLRYTASLTPRILTPGVVPHYQAPRLPLHIQPAPHSQRQRVVKPPLSTLLHVAHRAGHLLDGAPLAQEGEEGEGQGLTFVAYRNSLQSVLDGRGPTWRVDVQRWGRVVLLRRCLDYSWEDGGDVGHQFEKACRKGTPEGKEDDGGESGFRALVAGSVGRHTLVTSCEVDAVEGAEGKVEGEGLQVAQLMELKTVNKGVEARKLRDKQKGWWLQSFLGGIGRIKMGLKEQRDSGQVDIAEVKDLQVDGLVGEGEKRRVMGKLDGVLRFLEEKVEEGKVYKLVRERKAGQEGYQVALYEIVGGMDAWPVWKADGIRSSAGGADTKGGRKAKKPAELEKKVQEEDEAGDQEADAEQEEDDQLVEEGADGGDQGDEED